MAKNIWEHSRTESEFAEPDYPHAENGRYASPGLSEDAPYTDTFGWSPSLRLSAQEIPDNARLRERALRDFYPDGPKNPEQFYGSRDTDDAKRHQVESQDANGWDAPKGIGTERRWAANPREIPPAENRVTQRLAPRGYSFLRPFGHGLGKGSTPDRFNGEHFSMADHRRDYEIYGMAPVRSRRNTWRIEPTPWDADIVDVPANVQPNIPNGRVEAVEVNYSPGNRNWRL
jgi:hypothetical protein